MTSLAPPTQGKDLFQSKQTWGAIVYLISPLFKQFGFEVDQAELIANLTALSGVILYLWGTFSKTRAPVVSVAGIKKPGGQNHYLSIFLVLVLTSTYFLAGCVSTPQNLPVKGQAYVKLLEAEQIVTDIAETVAMLRSAGVIEKDSKLHNEAKKALLTARKKLDEAWGLYHAANFQGALNGSIQTRDTYLQLRERLKKLEDKHNGITSRASNGLANGYDGPMDRMGCCDRQGRRPQAAAGGLSPSGRYLSKNNRRACSVRGWGSGYSGWHRTALSIAT